MKVNYLGHSAFQIIGEKATILIDPFISGNSLSPADANTIEADYIIVTHGHGDHVGDTISIAKRTDAVVIAVNELAKYLQKQGCGVHPMHIGGEHKFANFSVKLTDAKHGSGIVDDNNQVYTGPASGVLIKIDDKILYHTGDTGLFGDMKTVIGDLNNIDLAMIPIGDNYVMGPADAVIATKWINPDIVIPMHYNTFPIMNQNPLTFKNNVEKETNSKCVVLIPGQSIDL